MSRGSSKSRRDDDARKAASAEPPHLAPRRPAAPGPRGASPSRPFRPAHAILLAALFACLAASWWTHREMAERYRFNIVRMPGLENQTGWARLTGWMPRPLSGLLTAVFTGSPPRPAADDKQRIERLAQTAKEFPYDGFLHLELARQYMRQARANRRADPDLLRQALAYNQRAFETHFDIDAYNQMAWTHIELSEALARQDARQALEHYRAAIDGFERVLVLKPGDVDALEHLGAIYSSVATRTKKPDDWNRVIAYAERLLDEEHYNPNALYFLGLAYDNLDIKERAVTYYSRAVRSANRIPAERLVWREQREAVITQLKKLGYSP